MEAFNASPNHVIVQKEVQVICNFASWSLMPQEMPLFLNCLHVSIYSSTQGSCSQVLTKQINSWEYVKCFSTIMSWKKVTSADPMAGAIPQGGQDSKVWVLCLLLKGIWIGDPFPALFFWKLTLSKYEGILWLFLRPEQKERRAVCLSVFAYASHNIWAYNKQDRVTCIF